MLALDYGEKRIGVAIANTLSRLPSPLTTVNNTENALQTLVELARTHNAYAVVVGLPKGLKGQETPQTSLIRQFIKSLSKSLSVPVYTQDETLSSVRAEEELKQRNVGYNKSSVDELAATYILEDFLTEHSQISV